VVITKIKNGGQMDQIAFLTILFDKEQTFKNSIQELDTIVSKME